MAVSSDESDIDTLLRTAGAVVDFLEWALPEALDPSTGGGETQNVIFPQDSRLQNMRDGLGRREAKKGGGGGGWPYTAPCTLLRTGNFSILKVKFFLLDGCFCPELSFPSCPSLAVLSQMPFPSCS